MTSLYLRNPSRSEAKKLLLLKTHVLLRTHVLYSISDQNRKKEVVRDTRIAQTHHLCTPLCAYSALYSATYF